MKQRGVQQHGCEEAPRPGPSRLGGSACSSMVWRDVSEGEMCLDLHL